MNIIKLMARLCLVLVVLFFSNQLFSQNPDSNAEEIYELVKQKYGLDQVLLNGKYFENLYVNDMGHPYFLEDEYKDGYLVIHNKKFENLKLKYNIFDQTLVVVHIDKSNSHRAFNPPMEFISEFSIDKHRFKEYSFPNDEERIYEEIYVGEISYLCSWGKDRIQSDHKQSFMAHKFSDPEKEYVLVVENKPYPIKNKNALLKLFSNHKKQIDEYIKQNKIKLNKSSDEQIAKLIAYCEELSTTNKTAIVAH